MNRDWVTAALKRPILLADLSLADWDLVLRQARNAALLAKLAHLIEEHGLWNSIPEAPRHHLRSAVAVADKIGREVRWEVDRIRRALNGVVGELILLKGAAYVMADLPPAQGRIFQDVDILVPRPHLDQVEIALLYNGWGAAKTDPYDQRYYRDWMHELPPMRHIKRQSVIDVHHTILPLTARLRPDAERLRAAAVTIPGHPGLKTLAPADMLLHSAVHLFYDGEFNHALRDLVDMDALFRHFGTEAAFWPALLESARAHGLMRPLYFAAAYTANVLQTPVPAEFIDEVCAEARLGAGHLRTMNWLLTRVLRPDHATAALPGTRLAYQALYVRSHWLRMPPMRLARHLFHKAFLSKKLD